MSTAQYVITHNALTQSEASVKITSPEKPAPNRLMLLKWQNMLDFVANLFGVKVSKITQVNQEGIDVVLSSTKTASAESTELGTGGMDEAVISHGEVLAIEDRKTDSPWIQDNQRPMAYLGFPIMWPDNEVFGTLSIEDSKAHVFSERNHKIMETFREMVNTDLALLMASDSYNKRSAYADMKVKPVKAGVCIYNSENKIVSWNQSAREILHYEAVDVLNKPVTFIFPMISQIGERSDHNVMAGNHQMVQLFVEQSQMLGAEGEILQVLSFSDQSDYLQHSEASLGELHRDDQSGVYDQSSISDLLTQEAKRALRYRQPLCVIGICVNGYKFIEDIHGEGSTDLIVQTLAIILKNETRDVDCIGRLTEDLFIIGLPSTDLEAARGVASRIDKIAARYSDDATPFTVKTEVQRITEQVTDWHEWILELLM